jgi:adenosylcobinamide-GDP ribazoletransferase
MQAVRAFAGAVAFLTRVPVGRWIVLDGRDVARGGAFFPVVGAGIGAAVGAVASLGGLLAAVLAVAFGAVLTGALHFDALADTADALGATTRERALAIMRDHQIGAYGALALVLDVGIRVAALEALHDPLRYAACAGAASRVVPVVLGAALPYARPAGLGRAVTEGGLVPAVVACAFAAAICLALGAWPFLVVAAVAAIVLGLAARAWLGGVTGDVLGASSEVTELAALVAAVALT